jgi:hypothetical protein
VPLPSGPQVRFANLPPETARFWGAGLKAEKIKEFRWLTPKLVGQFEFVVLARGVNRQR